MALDNVDDRNRLMSFVEAVALLASVAISNR